MWQQKIGDGQYRATTKTKDAEDDEKRGGPNNPLLRDLIKILLLNQLIHNRPPRPGRPPFPGPPRPPRPPYNPMPRPPFRAADESSEYQFYNNQDFPY